LATVFSILSIPGGTSFLDFLNDGIVVGLSCEKLSGVVLFCSRMYPHCSPSLARCAYETVMFLNASQILFVYACASPPFPYQRQLKFHLNCTINVNLRLNNRGPIVSSTASVLNFKFALCRHSM